MQFPTLDVQVEGELVLAELVAGHAAVGAGVPARQHRQLQLGRDAAAAGAHLAHLSHRQRARTGHPRDAKWSVALRWTHQHRCVASHNALVHYALIEVRWN